MDDAIPAMVVQIPKVDIVVVGIDDGDNDDDDDDDADNENNIEKKRMK